MAVPLYCACGRGRGLSSAGPWEPASPLAPAPASTHLYVLHGLGSSRSLEQGHCAATKATARHAAAINPGRRQRGLHQLVQLRAAHLVVIPAEMQGRPGTSPTRPGDSLCPGPRAQGPHLREW